MKRSVFLIIVILCFASIGAAQYKVVPNKPFSVLNSNPGFLSINEFTFGIGLAGKSTPYSESFFGFTTVFGYQVNRNYTMGAGTGFSVYDAGVLIPLFLDFRYAFSVGQLTPYLFADGGLLINPSDFNTTKLFINPGAGARYTIGRSFAVNLGAGILSQVDGENRASFVNVKLGGVYVF